MAARYPVNLIERNTWLAKDILVHERALRAYLGRFFKNVADVEDVLQDTYARLLSLNDSASTAVRNWHAFLFASARNVALDRIRKARVVSLDEQVEMEAAEWLARLDRDPRAAELTAFDRWGATDARNAAAYARLAATWQALDRIRAIRPSADEPIDNDYLNGSLQHSRPEPLHDLLPAALQSAAADSRDSQRRPSTGLLRDFSPDCLHESSIYDSQVSKSHCPF